MKRIVINLGMALFLFEMIVMPARADSEQKKKLIQQIDVRLKVYSDKNLLPSLPISTTLRMMAPDLVEKAESIHFAAFDYQFLSLKSLRYARYFLDEDDMFQTSKYIEKADRYYKLATSLQKDSLAVLQSTISVAEWMVVYKASRTALGFATTGLGMGASTLFDIGALYTDFLLDTSIMPLEEAKKNLITKAISKTLLRFIGASDFVGDTIKHGWGSSGAFSELQKIMGSSEFKDAALEEFMRLGGDVGDYIARKAIEEVLTRIVRGVSAPSSSVDEPIIESKTPYDIIEKIIEDLTKKLKEKKQDTTKNFIEDQSKFIGKYFNQDDYDAYIEIKNDGTVYV